MPVLLPLLDALVEYASSGERDELRAIFLAGHDEMPGPPRPVYTEMLPGGLNFIATHVTDLGDPIGVTVSDNVIGRYLNPLTGNNANVRKLEAFNGILSRLVHDPAVKFFESSLGTVCPRALRYCPSWFAQHR